ncbi:hypothetical protein OHA21_51090 [Actinoplanes sp. NBC_00393]|uniref:prenyltransferase/squalene oxidase repeat-containing protein n=1 Tax=Actinoplanes sp. NBC_00393 TaxID=2975953 RepID=UPI002E201AE9
MRKIANRIDAGVSWLVESGVQHPDGGFAAWYDTERHDHPYLYAEITGYLTTLFCQVYARTGDPRHRAAAVAAGDWLERTADGPTGAFRCLVPLHDGPFAAKKDLVYAFDTGVIVNGLANLYRITGDDRHLKTAVRAADWLTGTAQRPDGAFRPIWDAATGTFAPEADDWSWQPGGYHTKVALGLANLAELTGRADYRDAAIRACEYACAIQAGDGSIGHPDGIHVHPHEYAAEGLWAVGLLLDRPDFVAASRRATEWLLSLQREDGTVPRFVRAGTPVHAERVDVQAQALRLASLHGLPGRLAELTAHVAGQQAETDDVRSRGGWWFGRLSDGEPVPHVNVWVTAFAVQALDLRDGGTLEPRFLV